MGLTKQLQEKHKITIIAILLAIMCLITYIFAIGVEVFVPYWHLFYIPIIFASLWWKRKGVAVTIFSILLLFGGQWLAEVPVFDISNFARAGTFLLVACVVGLVSERQTRAEEALAASEERYRGLVTNVKLGIFRHSKELKGLVLEANPAMEEITGYSRQELLGMKVTDLYVHPEERRVILEELAATREKVAKELRWRKKDGSEITVVVTKVAVKDNSGEILHIDGILEDITERKRAEAERKEMEQKAQLASHLSAIGEMASGIAHEINNPLTAVIGFSQLVMDRNIPDDIRKDIGVIYSEAQRAAKVVKNLLTFARKHTPSRQLTNINSAIENTLKLRAYEHRINNIQVITQLDPNLPEIIADYFQMQQVFLNIILNGETAMLEAHNKGTLIITTQKVNNTIKVSFTDDGTGIAEKNLSRTFDPFFTTREEGKGTGLGLSISYGIVTEHGGRIYARSKLGEGATFVVELPITAD